MNLRMKKLFTILFIVIFGISNYPQSSSKDTLVFGSDEFYPPYEFLNDKGEPEGFNIDLVRELAREMGVPIKIKLGNWEQIRKELEVYGTVDISDMFFSDFRDSVVDFAVPHAVMYDEIYSHKDSKYIYQIEDLFGKKVVVQKASTLEEYMRINYPEIILITTPNELEALKLVSEKKYDAAYVSQTTSKEVIKKYNIKNLVSYKRPVFPREYCFVVKEGNYRLLRKLNSAIVKLIENGKVEELKEKWFEKATFYDTLTYSIIGLFIISLLFLVILFWNHSLRVKVKKSVEQFRASDAKYKAMVEAIPDLVFLCDKNGVFLDYTVQEDGKLYTSHDKFIGKKASEVLPSDVYWKIERAFNQCLSTGKKQRVEYNLTI